MPRSCRHGARCVIRGRVILRDSHTHRAWLPGHAGSNIAVAPGLGTTAFRQLPERPRNGYTTAVVPALVAGTQWRWPVAMPYTVYILASRKHGTLYIGVTNDIARRVWEHREGLGSGFVNRYRVTVSCMSSLTRRSQARSSERRR